MYKPNRVARLISAAYRHQLAYLNRNLTPFRLGGGSYIYLLKIIENPGIAQAELSTLLLIDRATVCKMLAALEREGMIRREPHPHDKRQVLLYPTPFGEETYGRMQETTTNYRRIMLDGIPPEEQAALERTLQRILDNLQEANRRDKFQDR